MPEDFIKVENREILDYEKNGICKSLFNLFFIPFLNNLSKKSVGFIKKSSKSASRVVENTTTHTALETLYNKGAIGEASGFIEKIFLNIWFNINNAKAVRNRLRLVKREFKKALLAKSKTKDYIHILSIASGSARAIVETLGDTEVQNNIDRDLVSVTFLDKNPHAIEYSKELSREIPNYNFNWINKTVGSFFGEYEFKESFDMVEIVGFLDYFDDDKTLEVFKKIIKVLKPDGLVIVANINDNRERKFITETIGWPMIYRTGEELCGLLNKAGFLFDNMDAYYEPLKIHSVVIAGKK